MKIKSKFLLIAWFLGSALIVTAAPLDERLMLRNHRFLTLNTVNRDIKEALQRVGDMVGNGYRPKSLVAGFLSAENLRYLAEEEGIHVCQGTIWSQYGIDNGDGDGSISYLAPFRRRHYQDYQRKP